MFLTEQYQGIPGTRFPKPGAYRLQLVSQHLGANFKPFSLSLALLQHGPDQPEGAATTQL